MFIPGAVPEGLVFTDTETWSLSLVESETRGPAPLGERGHSLDAHGSVLAVYGSGADPALRLLDVSTRTALEVERPAPLEWGRFGSFSPDGRLFAAPLRHPVDRLTALVPR